MSALISTPTPEPCVRARGVAKAFAGSVQALDGAGLELRAGELVGLIGANGSGKSTFLKILAGKFPPDRGEVRVLGMDPARRGSALRRRMAYLSQEAALDPEMTGREIIRLFLALHSALEVDHAEAALSLASAFGLEQSLDRRVSAYSGGMRQRLHMVMALFPAPEVLLCDEPTVGLDPGGRALAWEVLRERGRQGGAVAVATHDLIEAEQSCHRLLILEAGKILIEERPEEIVRLHGLAVFEADFRAPPRDLAGRASAWRGVARCELTETGIALGLREESGSDSDLVAALEAAGVEVQGYRRRRPDLAGAYFQITGRPWSALPPRRAGGRRRHA